jgi:2,4'-dihydroxyacetophenone dioxygenase
VPDDVEEMITLFHVTGNYTYVDPNGIALGYEDVFTKLANAQRHYVAIGRDERYIEGIKR